MEKWHSERGNRFFIKPNPGKYHGTVIILKCKLDWTSDKYLSKEGVLGNMKFIKP